AATTVTPLPRAYFTALAMVPTGTDPPRLMLMTWAPWSAAQRIPDAMPAIDPDPRADSTLIGMIDTPNATPATPSLLLVDWAMVPATWVPCPWSSAALSLLAMKLNPGTNAVSARSPTRLTPVSMTATVTPLPLPSFQAWGRPICRRCHW